MLSFPCENPPKVIATEVAHPLAAPLDMGLTGGSPLLSAVPVQFLDASGQLTASGRHQELDLEVVEGFYRDMFMARRLDTEALALQRQGELGLWLMSLGQEAAQVGSIRALNSRDYVFPSYREHAAALCRGISPADLLVQWRGNQHAGWDTQKHRFHMYTLVLGAQALHATGYAMGVLRDGSNEVVLTYFGDGAASQGDVAEALNWAAVGHVPIVFFCQNNQWAISTPASSQTKTPLHHRASGYGLDSYLVDGNDVLAVHAVTKAAVERTRAGGGPSFIEAITYRMAGHSTSDDPSKYRPQAEVDQWAERDPLARVESYLRRSGATDDFFDSLAKQSGQLAADVRDACFSFPTPSLESAFDHVYADPHPMMQKEREESLLYRAGFSDADDTGR